MGGLFAIAGPFGIEVDDGDHHDFIRLGSEHNSNMLFIMGVPFQRIRFPLVALFNLIVIDGALFQNLLHFRFIDMPAIHAATGMFGIDEVACLSVEPLKIGISNGIIIMAGIMAALVCFYIQ